MSVAIQPSKFKKSWGYKYVRFADGHVAFCDAGNMNVSHIQLVEEYRHPIMPGDPLGGQPVPAVSAGTIKVKNKMWYIESGGSSTAKLNRRPSDEKYIQRTLGQYGFYLGSQTSDEPERLCTTCYGTGQDDPPPGEYHGLCFDCMGTGSLPAEAAPREATGCTHTYT